MKVSRELNAISKHESYESLKNTWPAFARSRFEVCLINISFRISEGRSVRFCLWNQKETRETGMYSKLIIEIDISCRHSLPLCLSRRERRVCVIPRAHKCHKSSSLSLLRKNWVVDASVSKENRARRKSVVKPLRDSSISSARPFPTLPERSKEERSRRADQISTVSLVTKERLATRIFKKFWIFVHK